MYVLDTNTLIYFFKGLGNVAENLFAVSPQEIGVPAIVLFELEYGIKKSTSPDKRIRQLDEICSLITVLPFTAMEAKMAAGVRAHLEKKGLPIGHYDILIAAMALARQGTLITNNVKEFERVPQLKIDNWF
jgi:tRNA(fMet)-specific endonuclease VapC